MKMKNILVALALLATPFAITSCSNDTEAGREVNEAVNDVEEVGNDISAEFKQESAELERDFKQARTNINRRIEALEADLEGASAEARAEINEEIAELKQWGNDVDNSLDRMGRNISNEWKEFKMESRKTLNKIEREIENEDMD